MQNHFGYIMLSVKKQDVLRVLLFTLLLITSFFAVPLSLYAEEVNSYSADGFRSKGYAAQQQGNMNDAFSYYAKALSLDPLNTELLNDLGIIYEQTGFLIKAEEFYQRAVFTDEHYLPSYLNLAALYLRTGEKEKAFLNFKKRFELGGLNDEWGKKAREEMLNIHPEYKSWADSQEKRWQEESLVAQTLDEFDRKFVDAKTYYEKGLEYVKSGNLKKALLEIEQYLVLIPDDYRALEIKGRLNLELTKQEIRQRSDEAIENLNKGDAQGAKQEIEKMLALGVNSSQEKEKGKQDKINQDLNTIEAKDVKPESAGPVDNYSQWQRNVAAYHFSKGNDYSQKQNYKRAVAEYDRALKITPTDLNIVQARENAAKELNEVKSN